MTASPDSQPVEVTDDLFLGGALRMRQPRTGYRAGLDAILLAAACPAVTGLAATCLDCGAGAGVAGLAVARRVADSKVTLVERDPALTAIADTNIVANGLGERATVVTADLTIPLSRIGALSGQDNSFDHVIANPPFYMHGTGTSAPDRLKANSHAMDAGAFEEWVRFAAAMLKNGGSFTVVQRPVALPEILAALDRRFGNTTILPLHPRPLQPASRLLVQSIKASRAGLRILSGRVLHIDGQNAFTPEFDAILRDGAPLTMI